MLGLTPLQAHALRRFAEQGFSATKLSHIAKDAGIKPPSVYAHFKSKEALFLSLLPPTVEHELALTRERLAGHGRHETVLYDFLRDIGTRFSATHHMRFLVQAAFLPPPALVRQVCARVDAFFAKQTDIIGRYFDAIPQGKLPPSTLTAAYQGIMDSLMTALLFTGMDDFTVRLDALWAVFSLTLKEG